jgi:hypothetical protein
MMYKYAAMAELLDVGSCNSNDERVDDPAAWQQDESAFGHGVFDDFEPDPHHDGASIRQACTRTRRTSPAELASPMAVLNPREPFRSLQTWRIQRLQLQLAHV